MTRSTGAKRPRLPAQGSAADQESLRALRRFHLGSVAGVPVPVAHLPALLAPYRDPARVRDDYPLLVGSDGACKPLAEWLDESVPAGARVLRDNLVRLERAVRVSLDGTAAEAVERAGRTLVEEIGSRDSLADDIEALVALAPVGRLVALTPTTPLELLRAAADHRVQSARAALTERASACAGRLRALLRVEHAKENPAPDTMRGSLGSIADRFVDVASLAHHVGPHRGTAPATPERRERLTASAELLEHWLGGSASATTIVINDADPCGSAAAAFDAAAADVVAVARALRTADLELRGAYDPARHDALLAELSWHDLDDAELHAVPVVVAVVPAEQLGSGGLLSLSRLLRSGRPVQALVVQSPAHDPGEACRLELAYLGVAHREAFVQQSTAARPSHLLGGFERALAGSRTALHAVDSGLDAAGNQPRLGPFLHAGAAIESRAHPLFWYDPEVGETWARRLDFGHNPQPDDDWPASELDCDGGETLAVEFTFADFALLEPAFTSEFSLLDDTFTSDELVPVADWLALDPDTSSRRVPFIWVADEEAALHRVAIRRSLARACRDRLHFWRTLQELAGVRNEYVREAVQRARNEAAEQAARERDALEARHRDELDRTRQEATESAMQNLARTLLELDPLPPASPSDSPLPPTPAPASAPDQPEPASDAPELAPEPAEDPWIETARCSTCNDCVNLNPLLFVYDENKQARIGDPNKGTFAQLVQAAEKCPARCIHPGAPQNPDEPNLDELVARAAPFNL